MVNGNAKVKEKPNIPMIGLSMLPVEASTRIPPMNGAVQENETSTRVSAIKKVPINPPLSTCLSDLFVREDGRTISNMPKKEAAKAANNRKKIILVIQCELMFLIASEPNKTLTSTPITV
jgi:hypothetical protein